MPYQPDREAAGKLEERDERSYLQERLAEAAIVREGAHATACAARATGAPTCNRGNICLDEALQTARAELAGAQSSKVALVKSRSLLEQAGGCSKGSIEHAGASVGRCSSGAAAAAA
eukprot:CAMPEP_0172921994 /NCGR_PEP_ID=MMETSP1075-20121228/206984_1 /TAXON_ID=2916 /ORGANISM="Ceratium fusus, Strain PA161109" /LENGTH=116 /DNA_ID=CAMNT_0013782245 /DNA_START=97 /DNA_END=443 /DNA_ORIENTATION=-